MIVEVLKILAPLMGVVIGLCGAHVGERFRTLREDTRKLKRTVYYLLEIRHQLSLFHANEFQVIALISILKKKLPKDAFTALDDATLQRFILELLKKVTSQGPLEPTQDVDQLNRNFLACVDNLSEVDPVLAFRLNGKQNIKHLLKEFIDRSQNYVAELSHELKHAFGTGPEIQVLEPPLAKMAKAELDTILLEVASKAGRKIRKDVDIRLSRKKSVKDIAELEKVIDEMISASSALSLTQM